MNTLDSNFNDFLTNIRLTPNQVNDSKTGHETLRDRLYRDDYLKNHIITTFLQGSYKRHTAVRPKDDIKSDVDIVVVTNLKETDYPNPQDAINLFLPFVKKYYEGKYDNTQSRSIGIELSYVKLDLVITSAPSEAVAKILRNKDLDQYDEDDSEGYQFNKYLDVLEKSGDQWKNEPLRIPDRHAGSWESTHPLEQIKWTIDKNNSTNKHYINVVKAIKWWHRITPGLPKYPKSYPLEHIVGDKCLDGIQSVAEGITAVLENMVRDYLPYVSSNTVPVSQDRGVDHNVLARIIPEDFSSFYKKISEAAKLARRALDLDKEHISESIGIWQQLLGDKFPGGGDDNESNQKDGFSIRTGPSTAGRSTYA